MRTMTTRFVAVGVATAALYYSALIAAVEVFAIPPVAASTLCYVVAITFNYFSHFHWTYASGGSHTATMVRYLIVVGAGVLLNALAMHAGVNAWGAHYLLVQTAAFVLVIALNYVSFSQWVFRE